MSIGIIGGSGLYALEGIENVKEIEAETPFGRPSSPISLGELGGTTVFFLARHGKNHELLPSEVPYKANIYALKSLGVRSILSVGAVGSLQEEIRPCDMVLPDQYIDFTKKREATFFGDGLVGHVSMAKPICEKLSEILYSSASAVLGEGERRLHKGGTYICIEGPQFSSIAESIFYKSLGGHVIGMTNMPEAKLAREAQMAYAPLCIVTDYDSWNTAEPLMNMQMMLDNFRQSTEVAKATIKEAIVLMSKEQPSSLAHNALESSVYTPFDKLEKDKQELLKVLCA